MIAVYYACTIVQVSLAMGMSTVMLCFYHKRPCTTPIPKWVKVWVMDEGQLMFEEYEPFPSSAENVQKSPNRI